MKGRHLLLLGRAYTILKVLKKLTGNMDGLHGGHRLGRKLSFVFWVFLLLLFLICMGI
jgi:hypothetical protein